MQFEFSTAGQILFGPGRLREVGKLAAGLGRQALLVTGQDDLRAGKLSDLLADNRIESIRFSVAGEPTVAVVQAGLAQARQAGCDLIVACGGGSALDAGKAIAILLNNPGDLLDYLEVIGQGKPLVHPPLPYITIPTTAGTGAEVTRNAVLGSPEHGVKVSLRSPLLQARLALIDPELTVSLPPEVTASTGLDALTQLIEPFLSIQANPLTDALCREGLGRAARSLRRAYTDGTDLEARQELSLASLFSGLALANAKLGVVHGIASVVGGAIAAPHGVICARLLPHAMLVNLRALQQRLPGSAALARFDEIAQILTGMPEARAEDGIAWIQTLCEALQVAPLHKHGLEEKDFPVLVEKSLNASSTKGNPVKLTAEEMGEILAGAF
jgi:alcohol dehydrogenase class IV